jgi:hypothetical protein
MREYKGIKLHQPPSQRDRSIEPVGALLAVLEEGSLSIIAESLHHTAPSSSSNFTLLGCHIRKEDRLGMAMSGQSLPVRRSDRRQSSESSQRRSNHFVDPVLSPERKKSLEFGESHESVTGNLQ